VLRAAYENGARAAFIKHGLAQPSIQSVGIKSPVKAPGLPGPAKVPQIGTPSLKLETPNDPNPSLGMRAAKVAANVGMGASTERHDGPGGVPGEPADEGRRQRSVIDRTFTVNDEFYNSSSMPLPGASVSP
jgi:hypothetical protein